MDESKKIYTIISLMTGGIFWLVVGYILYPSSAAKLQITLGIACLLLSVILGLYFKKKKKQ